MPPKKNIYRNFLENIKSKESIFNWKTVHDLYNKKFSSFAFNKLRKLDFYCYLEDYLIPNVNNVEGETANKMVYFMSIIGMVNHKLSQNINYWNYLISFEKVFEMMIDFLLEGDFLIFNLSEKTQIIMFLNSHFKILENDVISTKLMRLTSPFLLYFTNKLYLKNLFYSYPRLISLYQKITKQIDDKSKKEYGYLIVIINDYFDRLINLGGENLEEEKKEKEIENSKIYFFKTTEFLIDLLSQITTRRFLKYYLEGENIIPLLKTKFKSMKGMFFNNFHEQIQELEFYLKYPLNEETGEDYPEKTQILLRTDYFNKIQFLLFKYFNLTPTMEELENLDYLKLLEFPKDYKTIFSYLNIPFSSESSPEFLLNQLKYFVPPKPNHSYLDLPLIPNEKIIWNLKKIPTDLTLYVNIPKLNLQFLSFNDYFLRNFELFRFESAFEIRESLEDGIKKMNPIFTSSNKFDQFSNWARMATKISVFTIHEVANPLLGRRQPSKVLAEIKYSTAEMPPYIKKEWDALRESEVLFLISFDKTPYEGETNENEFCKKFGVKYVRGCEIVNQFDEKNNRISMEFSDKRKSPEGSMRTLHVKMDPFQYMEDLEKEERCETEIYGNFKLLVRRKPKENIFKPILATISELFVGKPEIPPFMEEIILGYSDEDNYSSKYFGFQKENKIVQKLDFYDTFLDQTHLEQEFLGNELIPEKIKNNFLSSEPAHNKRNQIRFTKKQMEAICLSLNYGLTLIKGPPGTGKTDVVVQIVNLLYHNFPTEKILIITHSNTALNDIFEKIAKLDIDERHLLRLGMGEKDLDLNKNFGKYGRVNYLLERRITLLEEVKKLNRIIKKDENDFTCETAGIFFIHTVEKIWKKFSIDLKNNKSDIFFPFSEYFIQETVNGNEEIHENGEKLQEIRDCEKLHEISDYEKQYEEIRSIFEELKEIRPLELLRSNKERANFFLSYQAKIVAMTSTHAAMQRSALLAADFHYDTVVFEESAQIMEIESFICLALQKARFSTDEPRLKRIIMLGDPNQLPPIIKNSVIQNTANMQQSLFNRLIRLGAPIIEFDHQGRCRQSILDLFKNNYKNLTSLPDVTKNEYLNANIGFLHEFQFIDNMLSKEISPNPHFYQNLEEAEFIVSTYMYMILMGIKPHQITILTVYNGQKFLLRDIIHRKCSWSSVFKRPKKITTVDKYQGQQNDYILLSLVRTQNVGHIRDPRRLIVALSRARLGLYVFGRFNLFKGFNELKDIFNLFAKKPLELELLPDEREIRKIGERSKSGVRKVKCSGEMYKIVEGLLKRRDI